MTLTQATAGGMIPESDCPVIVLASGQTLKVRRVKLFEADKVNEIASLKASAMQSLGGVSTGIGFWGSPGWALGGAAVLGVVEGLLSSAARKQGAEQLRAAQNKYQEMQSGAMFFDAMQVLNTQTPYPQAWSAFGENVRYLDVSQLNWLSKKNLLREHNKTETDIEKINGKSCLVIRTEKRYIHDGDEFVAIETAIGTLSIRWSHVAGYFPPQARTGSGP